MKSVIITACVCGFAASLLATAWAGDAVSADRTSKGQPLALKGIVLPKPEVSPTQVAQTDPAHLPAGVDPIITGVSKPKD